MDAMQRLVHTYTADGWSFVIVDYDNKPTVPVSTFMKAWGGNEGVKRTGRASQDCPTMLFASKMGARVRRQRQDQDRVRRVILSRPRRSTSQVATDEQNRLSSGKDEG